MGDAEAIEVQEALEAPQRGSATTDVGRSGTASTANEAVSTHWRERPDPLTLQGKSRPSP